MSGNAGKLSRAMRMAAAALLVLGAVLALQLGGQFSPGLAQKAFADEGTGGGAAGATSATSASGASGASGAMQHDSQNAPLALNYFKIDNGTEYADFDAALAAVADSGTITMLSDVVLTAPIILATPKSYTFDLGGHTLSASLDDSVVLNIGYGNVSIKNGSITNNGAHGAVNVGNVANVFILSGNYTGSDDAVTCFGGTVTITAGHFICRQDDSDDGCLYEGINGSMLLASGSTASVDPWKNSPGATDVTIYAASNAGTVPDVGDDDTNGAGAAGSSNAAAIPNAGDNSITPYGLAGAAAMLLGTICLLIARRLRQ